jgi:predicted DNA-binding transcriptional regulator AlpA
MRTMNYPKYLQEQWDILESYAIYGPPDAVPGGPNHDDYFIAHQVAGIVADVRRRACRFGPDPGPCSDDTHAAMAYVGWLLQNQDRPTTLDVHEVARLLGCNERTVWRHEGKGLIPEGRRVGGLVRWDRLEIEEWLANQVTSN